MPKRRCRLPIPTRHPATAVLHKVLQKPWTSAPRRWTLGNGDIYEFYCTNNKELEELEKLRQQELKEKRP